MAEQKSDPKDVKKQPVENDAWFGESETAHNELPRFAMGDPMEKDVEDPSVVLLTLCGHYESTTVDVIDGKRRLLHQIRVPEPMKESERILLWGNTQIDSCLPTLPSNTKVRITYRGRIKTRTRKRPLKQIRVEWPTSVKRVPNPFLEVTSSSEDVSF